MCVFKEAYNPVGKKETVWSDSHAVESVLSVIDVECWVCVMVYEERYAAESDCVFVKWGAVMDDVYNESAMDRYMVWLKEGGVLCVKCCELMMESNVVVGGIEGRNKYQS